MPLDQGAVVAQIIGELLGRNRGVLPPGQPGMLPRQPRELDRAAPDLPDLLLPLRLLEQLRVPAVRTRLHRLAQLVCLLLRVRAVLGEQPRTALRQVVDPGDVRAVRLQVVDHPGVEALQADQPVRAEQLRHVLGRRHRVRIPDDQQRVMRRIGQQPDLRLQHQHARRLAPDQGLRDVEPVLRQQAVEVVSGHPARNVGIPLPNEIPVLPAIPATPGRSHPRARPQPGHPRPARSSASRRK